MVLIMASNGISIKKSRVYIICIEERSGFEAGPSSRTIETEVYCNE